MREERERQRVRQQAIRQTAGQGQHCGDALLIQSVEMDAAGSADHCPPCPADPQGRFPGKQVLLVPADAEHRGVRPGALRMAQAGARHREGHRADMRRAAGQQQLNIPAEKADGQRQPVWTAGCGVLFHASSPEDCRCRASEEKP